MGQLLDHLRMFVNTNNNQFRVGVEKLSKLEQKAEYFQTRDPYSWETMNQVTLNCCQIHTARSRRYRRKQTAHSVGVVAREISDVWKETWWSANLAKTPPSENSTVRFKK